MRMDAGMTTSLTGQKDVRRDGAAGMGHVHQRAVVCHDRADPDCFHFHVVTARIFVLCVKAMRSMWPDWGMDKATLGEGSPKREDRGGV